MGRRSLMVGAGAMLMATFSACSSRDNAAPDTSGMAAMATPAQDTGMGPMPGMDHTPARDADQEFTRMMIDHHWGMIVMSDSVLARNPPADVRADAEMMRSMQRAELQQMTGMLKADYAEDKMPMIMPSSTRMIRDITSKTGGEAGKAFRENVIAHHEEAIKMIDDYMARLVKPAIRQMAATMKKDQAREIAELKSKLAR